MDSSNIRVKYLFSAPMLQFVWKNCDQVNQDLRNLILEQRKHFPSERMSNAGGWQSPKHLQDWGTPAVEQLTKWISTAVLVLSNECFGEEAVKSLQKWTIAAWANINDRGDYNNVHNHSGGVWSGVYYVDAGTAHPDYPYSGVLSFRNPTLSPLAIDNLHVPEPIRRFFGADYSIVPRNGLMVVFPSWLEHYVHPYYGSGERISVSWDVIFNPVGP